MSTCGSVRGSHRNIVVASVLLCLFPASLSRATKPVQPLPVGVFSFDRGSPTVVQGIVGPADVLEFPGPVAAYPGAGIGLGRVGDDLDALSLADEDVTISTEFVVLFSVDRATIGAVPPDSVLVANGIPYNALDQAERGHAAADQFMSLMLFTRMGMVPPPRQSQSPNNVLTRNNFDEGGTGYAAQPEASAEEYTEPAPEDDVDAVAAVSSGRSRQLDGLYFTATADSPSLPYLSSNGPPSGANIFYDPVPAMGGTENVYAFAYDLGLLPQDDIDAILIFDDTSPRSVFNGTDQVIFSLAPGSPSLLWIPGASEDGAAADLYTVMPGGEPLLFARALDLGLGAPDSMGRTDNLDALDFTECSDALACALLHGIRAPVFGDWDHDADVDLDDLDAWVACLTGPWQALAYTAPSWACQHTFDGDHDTDVDLADFAEFQIVFTGTLPF